jgi:uncharacterized membrane protein YgdD (TMEM256/DUF423 family)
MSEAHPGLTPFARRWIGTGAVLLLLAVILGAFGTHLLAARLEPKQFASYQTGVLYHLLHALGLVLLGVIGHAGGETRWLRASALAMTVGIGCFSGAIYLITAGAPHALGMVAPIGGVSFMFAWVMLAVHARAIKSAAVNQSSARPGRVDQTSE